MHSLKASLFLVASLTTGLVCGDVASHLKKAPNKSGNHSMKNIDFIYIINLDQRPEKWKMSTDQLKPYNIFPYRFSAVNGWELTVEDINDVGLKFSPEMEGGFMATCYHPNDNFQPSHEIIQNYGQTYFCHCMARGTVGIALSHLSVLQDAYDSGYETIWVMEDDIEVVGNPSTLPDLIDKLDQLVGKGNWDVLFTDRDIRDANGWYVPTYWYARRPDFAIFVGEGANDFSSKTDVSSDFRKIGSRFGATSMILRRSGVKKILDFLKAYKIYLPYDMDFVFPRGIKFYTVQNDVVTNLVKAISDNGGANYLNK